MICGVENGTNGHHLAVFSVDSTLIGVLVVLAMPVKKLSKMPGNVASYPFNGWCIPYSGIVWWGESLAN